MSIGTSLEKEWKVNFYGSQKQVWTLISNQRNEMSELYKNNNIPAKKLRRYSVELFEGKEKNIQHNNVPELRHEVKINRHEVEVIIKFNKDNQSPRNNRKSEYSRRCTEGKHNIAKII